MSPPALRILALVRRGRSYRDGFYRDPAPVPAGAFPGICGCLWKPGWWSGSGRGSWAFFRLKDREPGGIVPGLLAKLDPLDPIMVRDRERLAAIRSARGAAAQAYFRRHAAEWDRIRKLHVADEAVEEATRAALANRPFRSLLDLGTGTGRMLEMFGPEIDRGLGLDMSLEMLALARARLDRARPQHCSVRQGDIYDIGMPKDSFDVVIVHQVLHFP